MYIKDLRTSFPPLENSNFVKEYSIAKHGELELHTTKEFQNMCLIGFRVHDSDAVKHTHPRIITITAYDKYGSPIPFMNEYDVYYIGYDRVNTWIPFSFPLHHMMIEEYTLTMKVIGDECNVEILEYPISDICPDKYSLVFQNEKGSIQCMYFSTAEPYCTRLRHPSFYSKRRNINFPNGTKIIPTIERIIDTDMPEWMDTTTALICELPLYDKFNVVYVQNNQNAEYSKEESCDNWSI